jgi:arylsulfatase
MAPTVMECLKLPPPAQIKGFTQAPTEGVSMAYSFDDPKAKSRHIVQYFEMIGHRALYYDGWRAVCPFPGSSFAEARTGFGELEITREKLIELDAKGWELYHVELDWAENHNLAAEHRDKLIELIGMWYVEAGKYNVLPIDSRGVQRFAEPRPQISAVRERYVYRPGTSPAPENAAVRVLNRPHTITALVEISDGNGEGVLLCHGSASGGYSLFLKDHRLHYVHNYVGEEEYHIRSEVTIADGRHELAFEFRPTGKADPAHGLGTPGSGKLFVDGKMAGEGQISRSMPILIGIQGGLSVGRNPGASVSHEYAAPFPFTGILHEVIVDVSGDHLSDPEAALKVALARQ